MKQGCTEHPLIQQPLRFLARIASVPVLLLLILLSILFPAVLFPALGIGDIKPLDLYFSYSPEQAYAYLDALGAAGRSAYTRMLSFPDLVFPLIYAMALSTALMLLLRRLLPFSRLSLCLFPFMIVIADWMENLSLLFITRRFPEKSDVIAGCASVLTSLKWTLIVLTLLILLGAVVVRVASHIRDR